LKSEPFFIVNPQSSNGKTVKLWHHLFQNSKDRGESLRYELTQYTMHAAQLASDALDAGFDTIIAVGGDGTVNEVLNGFYRDGRLIREDAKLAFIPSGTGGDLARTLGLLDFPKEDLLRKLPRGTVIRIDHGSAEFSGTDGSRINRYFINEASIGFSADTVKAVNRSTKLFGGKVSFLLGVLKCLTNYPNHTMEINVDSRSWYKGPVFLLAVSNGRYFGGGMKIAPNAVMTDGRFDTILVKAMTRRDVLKNIGKIYSGEHLSLPQVVSTRAKSVEIVSTHEVPIEMDGEQTGYLDCRFVLAKQTINFLVPSNEV